MADNGTPYEDNQDVTTSTKTRWTYIGTILAGVMVLSLPVIIGGAALGELSLDGINQAWFALYATVALMAATWAFGEETLKAVQRARGNK